MNTVLVPMARWFVLAFWVAWGAGITSIVSPQESGDADTNPVVSGKALSRSASQPGWNIQVTVSPSEPHLADTLSLEFVVEAEPGLELQDPELLAEPEHFSILRPLEPSDSPNRETKVFRAVVSPNKSGKVLLPRLAIPFQQRPSVGQVATGQSSMMASPLLELEILSDPNAADLNAVREGAWAPPPPITDPWTKGLAWIGLVAILILGWIAFWFIRTWKRKPKAETPEADAKRRLEQLLAERLPEQGRFQEFYIRLTGIVRQFIEKKTGLQAPERTTEEFWRASQHAPGFPRDWSESLHAFLASADLVKFAGQRPSEASIVQAIQTAQDVVERFASHDQPSGGNNGC